MAHQPPIQLAQNIFKEQLDTVCVSFWNEDSLQPSTIAQFIATAKEGCIGISPTYGAKCTLSTIALATETEAVVITLTKKEKVKGVVRASPGMLCIEELILLSPDLVKSTFKMDVLAASLFLDHGARITNGVDMLSVSLNDSRPSLEAFLNCLGGRLTLQYDVVKTLFEYDEGKATPPDSSALLAWAACYAMSIGYMSLRFDRLSRVDTSSFSKTRLFTLTKTIRDAELIYSLKPTQTKNEVEALFSSKKGTLQLRSTRFKTRIMPTSSGQVVKIEGMVEGKPVAFRGKTGQVKGRQVSLSMRTNFNADKIVSVTTIGRERLTNPEIQRTKMMLNALQRTSGILDNPFVQCIWQRYERPAWDISPPSIRQMKVDPSQLNLNESQEQAVNRILSEKDKDRVVLIRGPPGTGKTTVIAAAVLSIMDPWVVEFPSPKGVGVPPTMWLVAHSNVAVKNMAEKLVRVKFLDFKLLVSMDFHFDWHEHLYEKIEKNIIRSDVFSENAIGAERQLLDSRVVLCTLSMLSHRKIASYIQLVPPRMIIIDEASQIEIGDYFPVLQRFNCSLSKLVFIGDEKQLPPHGQSNVRSLRSIFEVSHLLDRAVFLDTQYRMPVVIGSFISEHVYKNKLKTIHDIKDLSSCSFVDVSNGGEKEKGTSWINEREIDAVVRLATRLSDEKKVYRVITPYDAQRAALENALKLKKLPWEDKCFTVDSFQGNEEDYIIISVVRTENSVGFLQDKRRVNVMLTRCKVKMIVCANRAFIEKAAANTLLGVLAKSIGETVWEHGV